MKAIDRVTACKAEIKAVYQKKLDAEDSLAKRNPEQAQSLHFSIAAAQRNGADTATLCRVFGVSEFYTAAVAEVYGK